MAQKNKTTVEMEDKKLQKRGASLIAGDRPKKDK
jgi:hypothetical protein